MPQITTAELVPSYRKQRCAPGSTLIERICTIGWDVTPEGCWNWRGSTLPNGRARLNMHNKGIFPYRATYEAVYGPIPEGLVAAHTCHNHLCINPDHIKPSTQKENMNMPREVLSELVHPGDVERIRAVYRTRILTVLEIARAFGISQKTTGKIVRSGPRKAA